MRYAKAAFGVGLVMALGAAVGAEQRGTATLESPPPTGLAGGLRFTAPWRPVGGALTRVVGAVVDSRQVVVARVKVRLRNLTTGEVIGETESDENGAYAFPEMEPGTYVVEMMIDNRYVVAVSNVGSVARYETLQTVVQLPGRWEIGTQTIRAEQDVSNFMGMSAATTLTAATLVTAVTAEIPTSDPGVFTSPQ